MSKTSVRPSGETSTDIHVPRSVSKRSVSLGACGTFTSHGSSELGRVQVESVAAKVGTANANAQRVEQSAQRKRRVIGYFLDCMAGLRVRSRGEKERSSLARSRCAPPDCATSAERGATG